MKKLSKLGETFRGAKGTYLVTKGHIDKYELYLNESPMPYFIKKNLGATTDDGDLFCTFKFIQAFQFKKDLMKRIEEIEFEYINSEEHLLSQLESGLMTKEEVQTKIKSTQESV